ncbi:WalW protein [Pedomonas mirosovicensis]|uniref:WalW protein n=1 Tax=Pedomonas mirosovicensis TaxID=2908641 RepID=UPI002167ED88|nr:WalW protein [Pedomonas mirosovicensis]MCH8685748.1 WalW protein [Pedomonas mirosovicensis]
MLSPESTDYVTFGPGFAPRVLVLVDTEEDFDWSQPMSRSNVSVGSITKLERAHRLFLEYGITPCYLIDYPIATTPQSIEVLRPWVDAGNCIIGSQLHPWVNPPFIEELTRANSFAGNLPRETERAKLLALTEAIETGFGVRPRVYRAGRYGVGPNSARILTELGYSVDVSVRPFFDYADEGGPNFRRILPQPYWADAGQQLLELPLTTTFTGLLRGVGGGGLRRRLAHAADDGAAVPQPPAQPRHPLARGDAGGGGDSCLESAGSAGAEDFLHLLPLAVAGAGQHALRAEQRRSGRPLRLAARGADLPHPDRGLQTGDAVRYPCRRPAGQLHGGRSGLTAPRA